MPIPFEIVSLIERLNQELEQMEQETIRGANLALQLLNRYTNNAILTQYYAYFETTRFFIITTRNQIHVI
ncbi:hypothetical protein [Chroococcus sp. FPU101]|uniref:hypothetical protein n=1 Tax=Chroococcus sp. FPU101 TaxID=1974212 RepID=UPI001A8F0B02|nr:hypothetical protein [Chroococcus sp. FPU101]GFE68094.1 hypothetical protein CFPU101_07040 [Chroococcus sp. FPU101]